MTIRPPAAALLGLLLAAGAVRAQVSDEALDLLLDQIGELRTETRALRAMVEEQAFEIRNLRREGLARYTSTDERLSALESASAAPPPAAEDLPPAVEDLPSAAEDRPPPARNAARGALRPAVLSEQQLYQMAYDSVINSDFEVSIAEFDQYLSIYPEGRFVANAHYWKGQAYLYLDRFDEARTSYEIILERHPDSNKAADTMYGLAQAYHGLGNNARARRLLNDIRRRYPNTGVANLADTLLLTLD